MFLAFRGEAGSPGVWLAKGPSAAKFMFGIAGKVVLSLESSLSKLNILFELLGLGLSNNIVSNFQSSLEYR